MVGVNDKTPVEALKEILNLSFPHCTNGNPNEDAFVQINSIAHETLVKIERLAVQKSE